MGERAKILVVDDEPANLEVLVRMLRKSYEVLTAGSGPDALALLEQHRFAAIISDQRMPDMTGTELLSRARELFPETVRMILTGYSPEQESLEAINEAHVATLLTKPVAPDTVQRAVADAVELYAVQRQNLRLAHDLAEARRQLGVLLEDRIHVELQRITRYGGVLSLVLCASADLAAFERAFQAEGGPRLRGTDYMGRLGGHVALLLVSTPREGATHTCERIGALVPELAVDFRVAQAPDDGRTVAALIAAAESAAAVSRSGG